MPPGILSVNRLLILTLLAAAYAAAQEVGARVVQINGDFEQGDPRVVLIGASGDNCDGHSVVPEGQLRIPLTGPCWKCDGENQSRVRLAVFARGRSIAYLTGDEICRRQPGAGIPIQLEPRTPVKVAMWAIKGLGSQARDQLANADWVLDQSRTGIALRPTFEVVEPSSFPKFDGANEDAICAQGAASQLFKRGAGAINVFFGASDSGKNFTCPSGNIIMISDMPELRILAHELGHALGLLGDTNDGVKKYVEGHTTNEPFFNCANTMWTNSHLVEDNFSLGQAFWIGVSSEPFAAKARPDGNLLECKTHPERCMQLAIPRRAIVDQPLCRPCRFGDALGIDEEQTQAQGADLRRRLIREPRHCTNLERDAALEKRFAQIFEHRAKLNPALPPLGSISAVRFRQRWSARAEVALLIEAAGNLLLQGSEVAKKRRELALKQLKEWRASGWTRGSTYLAECIRRLEAGEPPPPTCSGK